MSHPNNPYGGGPHGGNPFGPGGQQPVQHRRDCREPLRNPCGSPCNDDGDSEIVDAVSEMSGGGGSGGRGGGRDGAGGERPYDNGPSGDPVPNTGSGGGQGGGGGGKDGCGCMPGGGGGRGGGGGGSGGGGRGGSGGGGDGCGCDGCLIVMVLTLPFVALWSVLRALVGKRSDVPAKPLSTVDTVLPNGRAARTLFRAVRWYRLNVSPRRAAPVCRYTPSCSTYAATSLQRHGAWRGGRMTLRRLSRCNRSHPGGHDPVPADSRVY